MSSTVPGEKGKTMLITDDGYSLTYNKGANQIIICMPQTMRTLNNTTAMVTNRRVELTPGEEALILNTVRFVFGERKDND